MIWPLVRSPIKSSIPLRSLSLICHQRIMIYYALKATYTCASSGPSSWHCLLVRFKLRHCRTTLAMVCAESCQNKWELWIYILRDSSRARHCFTDLCNHQRSAHWLFGSQRVWHSRVSAVSARRLVPTICELFPSRLPRLKLLQHAQAD